jgi:hypothetical protein
VAGRDRPHLHREPVDPGAGRADGALAADDSRHLCARDPRTQGPSAGVRGGPDRAGPASSWTPRGRFGPHLAVVGRCGKRAFAGMARAQPSPAAERRRPTGKEEVRDACYACERTDDTARRAPQPGDGEGQNRTGDTTIFSRGSWCNCRARPEATGEDLPANRADRDYRDLRSVSRDTALVRARGRQVDVRRVRSPGSARMPSGGVSGDVSAGEASRLMQRVPLVCRST